MADVSVKMGVSGVNQFKQGMKDAQQSVKTLNEALKLNENQLKLNGDKELYLQNKTTLLKKAIAEQTNAVQQGMNALKTMTQNGVDPASKAFQDMERNVYKAQNELVSMQIQLQELGTDSLDAAEKTDQLADSLGGLNKKVSLEQVISGIGKITTGLENAAKKAIQLGETIWTNVMDAAAWADDAQTMALMYGIDMDTYLRVQKLVENGLDTSVEAILKSQSKLKKNVGTGSDGFMQTMKELGLLDKVVNIYGEHFETLSTYDPTELFWKAGEAIMALGDEYEQEAKAQEIFGKSWRELIPLFTQYHNQEEFSKALEDVNTVSEEEVSELARLNDEVGKLKGNFDTLEKKVMAGLAPALTAGAEAMSGLLDKILKYLDTEDGQKALDSMATAVSGLFEDLGKIDPDKVVEGFSGVFNKIVEGIQWLDTNKETLKDALGVIVGGWATAKITGGALTVLQLIQGISGLTTGTSAASAAGSAAGSAWANGFAGAASTTITTVAPFLAGILGVTAAAVAPAVIAQEADYQKAEDDREKALEIAAEYEERNVRDSQFMRRAANAMGLQRDDNGNIETGFMGSKIWGDFAEIEDVLMDLSGRSNQQLAELANAIHLYAPYTNGEYTFDLLQEYWKSGGGMETGIAAALLENVQKALEEYTIAGGHYAEGITAPVIEVDARLADDADEHMSMEDFDWPDIEVEPVVPDNAAETISKDIGTVEIPVSFTYGGGSGGGTPLTELGLGLGNLSRMGFHANGIWSVPFDGYMALLHKNERVVPAREAASRNFSSNLYVESMYMNNGQDSDALAAKVAAENRRIMSGFGSNI